MNIRGLCPKSNRTKIAYLSDLACESNAPFIALQETHLSCEILSAEIQIPGYTLYRSDRLGGRTHGGVAMYIRNDLTVSEISKHSNNFCESQALDIKELDLIIINIYRPPKSPLQLFQETLDITQVIVDRIIENKCKSRTLLVVGDYNFPFIKWPNTRIYSRDEEPNEMSSEKTQAKMLLDWADRNFLEQYINSPTRGENILDLVFSNSSCLINGYSIIVNCNFSDHNIIKLSLNFTYKNEEKRKRINPYPNKIFEYDLMNASEEDWTRYNILMSKMSEDFDVNTENENTNERLKRFYDIIEKATKLLFEKKESFKNNDEKDKTKPKNKIPKNIRILLRKQSSLSKQIILSKSGKKTMNLMKNIRIIEDELKQSHMKRRIESENIALSKIRKNPKYFYNYANKFSKTKNKIGPLINHKGDVVKDNYEMTELLRKQYESTFSKPNSGFNIYDLKDIFWEDEEIPNESEEIEGSSESVADENDLEKEQQNDDSKEGEKTKDTNNEEHTKEREEEIKPKLTNCYFTYEDIMEAIDQLSACSGPGPDGLPSILLKKAKLHISLMLKNIFQHSIDNSEIPEILKLGYICPILKPSSIRERPSAWRPVSLTSHVIKTLERVLRKTIVNFLELNNLLDPNQHGSRRKRSCLSQLIQHHDEILRMLETGDNVDVDFEKAYEKIYHLKLMEKYKSIGIEGKIGKWLQKLRENRTQQVLIEGTKSEKSNAASGSVQGSVLGPVQCCS